MLPVQDFRIKLLAQRLDLFRQVARTEDDLLWLETNVERESEERGQAETMIRLLDRLMNGPSGRLKLSTVLS